MILVTKTSDQTRQRYVCIVITYTVAEYCIVQPYMIVNPARGQLNREFDFFPLSPLAPDNFASRDGFARPVPRQPAHSEHSS